MLSMGIESYDKWNPEGRLFIKTPVKVNLDPVVQGDFIAYPHFPMGQWIVVRVVYIDIGLTPIDDIITAKVINLTKEIEGYDLGQVIELKWSVISRLELFRETWRDEHKRGLAVLKLKYTREIIVHQAKKGDRKC